MSTLAQPTPGPSAACQSCSQYRAASLKKLGLSLGDWDYVVALAGNPNVGKSTVFNALTGLRQHTGNWPGKTVTRMEGAFEYAGKRYKLVDLPGTYSLLAISLDEQIARDFILFGQPDVTLVVVDATRLERNLHFVLQVLEITDRAVVCLNLMDEARRHKLQIDERTLARELGIPVVPSAARQGEGLEPLLAAVAGVAEGTVVGKPKRRAPEPLDLREPLDLLTRKVQARFPDLPNPRWVAMMLLEGDERISQAVRKGELAWLGREPAPGRAAAMGGQS